MSLNNELSKLINPPKNEIKGTIGMSRTVINVAGRGGFVWVRLLDNPNEVVKAHNPTVSPAFGMPVVMEWDGYKYEITGKDVERYAVWGSDSPLIGKHGQQHSAMRGAEGDDIVWVDSRQFLPLLVMPYGVTGSNSVAVAAYPYKNSQGEWGLAGNTGTLNLYPPSTTGSNVYLLMLNDTDFSLYTLTGTTFPNDVTGVADIVSRIPDATNQLDVPLAAIKVSQNKPILWDDIYDVRQFIGNRGSSSLISGSYLSFVYTDTTLTGDGTAGNPLSVVSTVTGTGSGVAWFNVKDYGALGDNSTDDYTAINDALTDLKALGSGVLYFPAQNASLYRISSTLVCQTPSSKSNILIYADAGVEIRPTGDFDVFSFNQDSTSNFSALGIQPVAIIENITIHPVTTGQGIGIYQKDSYGVVVKNCKMMGLKKGILLDSHISWNEGWNIYDTLIDGCTTGIEFLNSGGSGSFQSGHIVRSYIRTASGGTAIKVGANCILLGCEFDTNIWPVGNNTIGIDMGGDSRHSTWTGIVDLAGGTPTPSYALKIESTATNLTMWNFSMEFWGTYSGGEQESGAVKNASSISWTHSTYPYGSTITESDPVFVASEAHNFVSGDKSKLDGIEAGAEVNNISDANATELTGGGSTTLHHHAGGSGGKYLQFLYSASGGNLTILTDTIGNPLWGYLDLE